MPEDSSIEKNLKIMEVVEKELNRRKQESTFCFSIFLAATSVWILLVALWEKLGRPIAPKSMTYGVEIIALLMMFVTKKRTHMQLKDMRISKKNLGRSLIRAICICLIIIAVMVTLKLTVMRSEPFADWSRFNPAYVLTSIFQEFLARGFLLTCLINILDHKEKKHVAVLLSSLLFTSLHLYYGFTFMAGAGVLSVLLGYVCLKDENIWGVSLIHFVFGMAGTILGFV